MADKAAEYAERDNGVLVLSAKLVHVRNAAGTTYRLTYTPDNGWQCTCPAFARRPAVINGRSYCKHIMAMAIHERINGGLQ
ncbi:MAG: SWIM zinc finger family protein [Flavobacteriales bacterium]|nr:SWIM zinc finger family protein [Flavobacteriales bacterium]